MKQETLEEVKNLTYYKFNAEEDYLAVPISVLRYISQLEQEQQTLYNEEEVLAFCEWFFFELYRYGYPTIENTLKALKQFKKK